MSNSSVSIPDMAGKRVTEQFMSHVVESIPSAMLNQEEEFAGNKANRTSWDILKCVDGMAVGEAIQTLEVSIAMLKAHAKTIAFSFPGPLTAAPEGQSDTIPACCEGQGAPDTTGIAFQDKSQR